MKPKLILLGAPSGVGKSTVARILMATDNRFKQVQVYTTRELRPEEVISKEKIHVTLSELEAMFVRGELANFNEKDDVYYGITFETISSILKQGKFPVLEWDINRINYWDDKFPVIKIILQPQDIDAVKIALLDGRDRNNTRLVGVLRELELINSGKIECDGIIRNAQGGLFDTVQSIRALLLA